MPAARELSGSFKGGTSTDPDGDTLTYSWDFGDTSPAVTTEDASHTYTGAGARTVTLTVNDGKGHTDTDTVRREPEGECSADGHDHRCQLHASAVFVQGRDID